MRLCRGSARRSLVRILLNQLTHPPAAGDPEEQSLRTSASKASHAQRLRRSFTGFRDASACALNVSADVASDDLGHIPPSGPIVVVANHPLGAIDGLLLISLLSRVRSDIKLLGNSLLRYIPALRPYLFAVDVQWH